MTDILISDFSTWLSQKYALKTAQRYARPLYIAAEKGLCFAEIEELECDDCFRLLFSHNGSRYALVRLRQAMRTYRDFLDRTGGDV